VTWNTRDYWEAAARGVFASDVFDRVRTGWSESDFDARTDETICQLIDFCPDDVVLDYGCGPGYACRLVRPRVRRYVGADYSAAMLDIARRRNPEGEFRQCDGENIPAEDGEFDCIFCELVFQHNERPATLRIIEEMKRVIKPNGRAALQLPTLFYGKDIGFTVDELAQVFPGWRIESDPVRPAQYIHCLT
jgi:ubiquinone/menaquinone biosynthesis C-methylase UbiE